jgi:ParB family transcriptional regulator, chromosome partitioning protein
LVRDPATDTLAEDDSLAENIERAPLHPLDQVRAFFGLREKGRSEEDIVAAFFTSVNVVKQRLRLASLSPHRSLRTSSVLARETGAMGPRLSG